MPEVAGNAALIIDPFKPEEITEAITNLLKDETLRTRLIAQGLIQADKFSWKAMAQSVLELYQEIGDKN
jgi:glycosyltransferase involved in cell wall biosynthesis